MVFGHISCSFLPYSEKQDITLIIIFFLVNLGTPTQKEFTHCLGVGYDWNAVVTIKKIEALEPNGSWLYPIFCSMKQLGVFVLPLDGMLVHHRSIPCNLLGFPNNSPVPIYEPGWPESGTVTDKCLSKNTTVSGSSPDCLI